jgi:hypothetical protein
MWILAHRCPPPPIGNADKTLCANNKFCGFFSCSVRHSYWRRVRRCAIILADCKEDECVLCASPIFKPIPYKLSISNRRRKYFEEKTTATLKFKQSSIATVLNHLLTVGRFPTPLIFRYPLPLRVLSSEMDPPEIRFKGLYKRERRAGFKKNSPAPHPVRAL